MSSFDATLNSTEQIESKSCEFHSALANQLVYKTGISTSL